MPPKFESFIFFKKNLKSAYSQSIKACTHHLNFQKNIFLYVLIIVRDSLLCEFQHTSLWKMIFFSMFHTFCEYEM
jgi:hypothetical protein